MQIKFRGVQHKLQPWITKHIRVHLLWLHNEIAGDAHQERELREIIALYGAS